ncbi:hypothetical protein EON63_17415 [archaeon]|nr:MAG: hypothetical protein EON63_17415 [archaeon]
MYHTTSHSLDHTHYAPYRYARYAHSLDAIDTDGDGKTDMMILMGGFAPYPSNDIWISEDGNNWIFAGRKDVYMCHFITLHLTIHPTPYHFHRSGSLDPPCLAWHRGLPAETAPNGGHAPQ